jgi:hypothetical protein
MLWTFDSNGLNFGKYLSLRLLRGRDAPGICDVYAIMLIYYGEQALLECSDSPDMSAVGGNLYYTWYQRPRCQFCTCLPSFLHTRQGSRSHEAVTGSSHVCEGLLSSCCCYTVLCHLILNTFTLTHCHSSDSKHLPRHSSWNHQQPQPHLPYSNPVDRYADSAKNIAKTR